MIRILIFALLVYLLYHAVKAVLRSGKVIDRKEPTGIIDEMVQDPVCKTYIPKRNAVKRVIGGKEYYYCSRECASKHDPESEPPAG